MRFDYSGTGDSSGEYAAASLAHWRSDTEDAIEECRRLSGRTSVCIVGFRLGATLAAQAAAGRDDVDSLVLYAPVIDGASLIAEWEDEQKKFDLKHSHAAPLSHADELLGFPLTKSLRSDLEKPLFVEALSVSLRRVLILAHDHDAVAGLADGLGSSGASVSVEIIDTPEIWRREPLEAFVPLKLLRRIVEWINEVST